jgi:hypothetical protein
MDMSEWLAPFGFFGAGAHNRTIAAQPGLDGRLGDFRLVDGVSVGRYRRGSRVPAEACLASTASSVQVDVNSALQGCVVNHRNGEIFCMACSSDRQKGNPSMVIVRECPSPKSH